MSHDRFDEKARELVNSGFIRQDAVDAFASVLRIVAKEERDRICLIVLTIVLPSMVVVSVVTFAICYVMAAK